MERLGHLARLYTAYPGFKVDGLPRAKVSTFPWLMGATHVLRKLPIARLHEFLGKALREHGFASAHFGSGPFDQQVLARLKAGEFAQLDKDGEELLILASTPKRAPAPSK
jgi:hypothetical protein